MFVSSGWTEHIAYIGEKCKKNIALACHLPYDYCFSFLYMIRDLRLPLIFSFLQKIIDDEVVRVKGFPVDSTGIKDLGAGDKLRGSSVEFSRKETYECLQ